MENGAQTLMKNCTICPRECGTDRFAGTGFCKSGAAPRVNRTKLHFWEEPVISGERGSGAIFFSGCTMRCVYCQNHRISQEGRGADRTVEEVASLMLDLQKQGAHNVNLVTASHFTPQAAEAIRTARGRGLSVPVVWNSNAYEKPDTLRLLEGLVDIYLPDFRYLGGAAARRYSATPDYPDRAQEAIAEMHRQAGRLEVRQSIAVRGLLVRLLVLPGMADSIRGILAWIRDTLGAGTWVSLMGQYYPAFRSAEFPEIDRPVSDDEYDQCLGFLYELGFENGFTQDVGSCADYTPEFE